MTINGLKRKLTAILSADVKGYSLLMAVDEVHTIQTLKVYRSLMSDLIKQHSGRVVDNPGDNLLAEFSSAVDAVEYAVNVQNRLKKENAKFVDDKRLQFRIGINIGDVVKDGDRIYGSGVNVAARIEGIAEPGGISISRNAYDHVKDKLDLGFEYLGEHEVKNIKEPVRVYRVLMGTDAPKPLVEKQLELPDRPSIAVLPFTNMSGDPDQEYFSDGITNDIITDLSKFRDMFVVASNSTFTYENKPTKVQEVSRELGVRYVLEGGVQKSGDQVRINVQLIDATTGQHLWAERFDRSMDDIFAVQDEITEKIVATVYIRLDSAVRRQAMRKPTESMEAYYLHMRAREIWHRWGKENNDEARRLWGKAIELDPEYAIAYGGLAWTLSHDYVYYGGDRESLEQAFEAAQKAVSLDSEHYMTQWTFGFVLLQKRLYNQAMASYENALALNTNQADLMAEMANALTRVGRPQDAIEQMKQAMRLNPFSPNWYTWFLGLAYYHAGQYEEAIEAHKPLLHSGWHYNLHLRLAASYAQLGSLDEARAQAAEALKLNPDFSIATFIKTEAYKNPSDLEHYLDGLRRAGLPE